MSLGNNVLVVGSTGGLGSAMVSHLAKDESVKKVYASCRKPTDELKALKLEKIIEDIDLLTDDCGEKLVAQIDDKIDLLIVVAGYFTTETFDELDFAQSRKMMEICAFSPLKIVHALVKSKKLVEGSKVLLITSEGGSIGLRTFKEGGGNYGHHMSKCAENMMGRLLAWDLRPLGIAVGMAHPGFLRTPMTEHYSHHYEEMGAVLPEVAVPKILKTAEELTLENSGRMVAPLGSSGLGLGIYALSEPLEEQGQLPW